MREDITVYHSQAERTFDTWLWSGGWQTILILVLAVYLIGLVLSPIFIPKKLPKDWAKSSTGGKILMLLVWPISLAISDSR